MFKPGEAVFVTSGPLHGMSGVILNGSTWHKRYAKENFSDQLYCVHIDGVPGPSSKIWGIDLVPFYQRKKSTT